MEKTKKVLFVLSAILFIGIILFFILPKPLSGIEMFEEEFGLTLPKETKIIYSEDEYGWMGDGYELYIYQLSSNGMGEVIEQINPSIWSKLPFYKPLADNIKKKIDDYSTEASIGMIDIYAQNGYSYLKNSKGKQIEGIETDAESFDNIVIGIVDEELNKIYYYKFDK